MSPDELRSFREVSLQVKNLRNSMEVQVRHLNESIDDLKKDIQKSTATKLQIFLVVASSVIGPTMVGAAKYIFWNR